VGGRPVAEVPLEQLVVGIGLVVEVLLEQLAVETSLVVGVPLVAEPWLVAEPLLAAEALLAVEALPSLPGSLPYFVELGLSRPCCRAMLLPKTKDLHLVQELRLVLE
jgi:hypothetical protein